MTIEDLEKYIDTELQWLRYYAIESSRKALNKDCDIYETLSSIGYTKKVMRLDLRCSPCTLTSKTNTPITQKTLLEDLVMIPEYKNNEQNKFSALEVYWILFPEKRDWIIEKLNT